MGPVVKDDFIEDFFAFQNCTEPVDKECPVCGEHMEPCGENMWYCSGCEEEM